MLQSWSISLIIVGVLVRGGSAYDDTRQQLDFFEAKIRPLLLTHCYECHHGAAAENGLRIDSRAALLKGGDRGAAVVPGKTDNSLLLEVVQADAGSDLKMPPNGRLTPSEIADLTKWIRQGAVWPVTGRAEVRLGRDGASHWAFQPLPEQIERNSSTDTSPGHPIDDFIARGQRNGGTRSNPRADADTLLRRIYFDLIGLPPTFDEIEAFRAESARHRSSDAASDASRRLWQAVIDRLLDSPRYGERWGRHWMDVVRYADTAGDNADYPIPEMRLYRDYIIDAFNADKPFDQFVREQVAGDILALATSEPAPPTGLASQAVDEHRREQIIATGFVALTRRYGTIEFQHQHLIVEGSIESTGRAFLGLSLRCARCHDHKFDPITKKDYYRLYGIFASTQYPFAGAEVFASLKTPRKNFVPLDHSEAAQAKVAEFRKQTAELEGDIRSLRTGEMGLQLAGVGDRITQLDTKIKSGQLTSEEMAKLRAELVSAIQRKKSISDAIIKKEEELRKSLPRSDLPADLPSAYAVTEGVMFNSPIHKGGQPTQLGEVVPRGLPAFLSNGTAPVIPQDQSGRLQMAQWLTDAETRTGALLARVICNRVWLHHFGEGLVRTPNNFGLTGTKPTHPQLLDFLARYLVDSGWSIKSLHRLILTSRTYQLSSAASAENEAVDPDNKTLWRYARRRLDAEAIRDRILFVCGTLDFDRPGRHPFPPIESWNYTQHNPFQDSYQSSHRSVYLMTQRFRRHPYLGLFDQADANASTGQRTRSTVPQQSLFLMNNPWLDKQARALASGILVNAIGTEDRINTAFRIVFARHASDSERRLSRRHLAAVAEQAGESQRNIVDQWASLLKVLLMSNEILHLD